MKKKVAIMLIGIMLFSFGVASASSTFSDVKTTDWFYKDMNSLVELKAISGYTDGTFKPTNKVTRAEFIKILIEAIGETATPTEGGNWASGYIKKAEELNIIDQGVYREREGDKVITRNEVVKIISKVDSILFEGMEGNITNYDIKDIDLIPREYREYVENAYSKGLIAGFPDGRFAGLEGLSRAEAAVIIVRVINPSRRLTETASNIVEEPVEEIVDEYVPDIIEEPIIEDIVNEDDYIIVDGKTIYKSDVIEELKRYPIDGNDLAHYNNILANDPNNLNILSLTQEIHKITVSTNDFMNAMFNRNPNTNIFNLKEKTLPSVQDWWIYKDEMYAPDEFIEEWLKDTINYNIDQEAYFITDETLTYKVNFDGYRVRGRLYFKYNSHNNPNNIANELYTSQSIEIGNWYYVDIDVYLLHLFSNAPKTVTVGYSSVVDYGENFYLNKITKVK